MALCLLSHFQGKVSEILQIINLHTDFICPTYKPYYFCVLPPTKGILSHQS